ncbi:hypothetical protein JCM19046_3669 [Bacillus sp. JCM 19046]|nr:hypothetical protein JCM19045_1726 [Bacillus sp. JCM 19045]GAF19044.1 hypothetical protein JCM19046_3669 [Bacillus sp. JCM 19046]
MGAIAIVAGIYIIISLFILAVGFSGDGLHLVFALFTGIGFIALFASCVKLLPNQEVDEAEDEQALQEVAVTKETKQRRIPAGEAFLYLFVTLLYVGWFLTSFLPESSRIEAHYISEMRIDLPILALVTYAGVWVYFRDFRREEG